MLLDSRLCTDWRTPAQVALLSPDQCAANLPEPGKVDLQAAAAAAV
jgi:hypothetical protein